MSYCIDMFYNLYISWFRADTMDVTYCHSLKFDTIIYHHTPLYNQKLGHLRFKDRHMNSKIGVACDLTRLKKQPDLIYGLYLIDKESKAIHQKVWNFLWI
ncbi:hypothetical protein TorRG33x02_220250 [Trema orientale]|uniref:Uncharacterized protein n=1 Tax=Trema orientale TaxID=63057 RepID=A0A2P5E9I7_TREOI|nr:hypothetical protein TorRG33x02_220250 [Trema orientale]